MWQIFKKPGTSWSHRKSDFLLNKLSWNHNSQDILAFPAICHLKHTSETSKTLKLHISQIIAKLLEVRDGICWFRIKNWRLESPYSDQLKKKINKSVSSLLWHLLLSFEHRGRYSHKLFMNAPHIESHRCSLTSSFN